MAGDSKQLPSGFRIDVQGELVKLSVLKRSPRGTRYIAGQIKIDRKGKTKEEFSQAVEKGIQELAPGYPA